MDATKAFTHPGMGPDTHCAAATSSVECRRRAARALGSSAVLKPPSASGAWCARHAVRIGEEGFSQMAMHCGHMRKAMRLARAQPLPAYLRQQLLAFRHTSRTVERVSLPCSLCHPVLPLGGPSGWWGTSETRAADVPGGLRPCMPLHLTPSPAQQTKQRMETAGQAHACRKWSTRCKRCGAATGHRRRSCSNARARRG